MADENENTVGQELEQDQELSSAQELSFIPKATLQEKMNKFFMEWVEGSDEEPRTDIEELLQEFRKEKKEEGREELNERMDEDISVTAQDIAVPEEPQWQERNFAFTYFETDQKFSRVLIYQSRTCGAVGR